MMVNNIRNTTVVINNHTPQKPPQHTWQQMVMQLVEDYLRSVPPNEVARELRSFFLLHISGLRAIPQGFETSVLKMLVILEMLDEELDKRT